MLCRAVSFIKPYMRKFATNTQVIPFDRGSPQMVAKYRIFRNEGISKRRTISPLQSLLNETKQHVALARKQSHDVPQRFSKRLSDLGMFSRNYAETLIRDGIFFVDGKRITDPSIVISNTSSLAIHFPSKVQVILFCFFIIIPLFKSFLNSIVVATFVYINHLYQ